jgi:hypothetical protein
MLKLNLGEKAGVAGDVRDDETADLAVERIGLSFPRKWESAVCEVCERNGSQTSASNVLSVQTLALSAIARPGRHSIH